MKLYVRSHSSTSWKPLHHVKALHYESLYIMWSLKFMNGSSSWEVSSKIVKKQKKKEFHNFGAIAHEVKTSQSLSIVVNSVCLIEYTYLMDLTETYLI